MLSVAFNQLPVRPDSLNSLPQAPPLPPLLFRFGDVILRNFGEARQSARGELGGVVLCSAIIWRGIQSLGAEQISCRFPPLERHLSRERCHWLLLYLFDLGYD